jgi:aldose 1-epimerase
MSSLGASDPARRKMVSVVAGDARLVLTPAFGGAVFAWTRGDEPIFRPALPGGLDADNPRELASYPLFPFSGRVAGRRFAWAGTSYELPALLGDWAIHGAGWQLPWRADTDGARVVLSLDYPGGPLYPFAFHAEQIFELEDDALSCTCVIENRHDAPAPFAFGQHPFFPRSPEATLQFKADGVVLTGPDLLPVGHGKVPAEWDHTAPRLVGAVPLDACFTGWDGVARIVYPDRGFAIDITAAPVFANLVVYIPPHLQSFAVEPVANITNALNRMEGEPPSGMFILGPGERRRGTMRFAIAPL